MPDIKLARKHHLSIAQAKKIAQKAADDLAREYDLESDWSGDRLRFERSGVNGHMDVSGSEIKLEVTLGLLLKAFKGKIEQHVSHRLDELLTAAAVGAESAKPAKAAKKSKA